MRAGVTSQGKSFPFRDVLARPRRTTRPHTPHTELPAEAWQRAQSGGGEVSPAGGPTYSPGSGQWPPRAGTGFPEGMAHRAKAPKEFLPRFSLLGEAAAFPDAAKGSQEIQRALSSMSCRAPSRLHRPRTEQNRHGPGSPESGGMWRHGAGREARKVGTFATKGDLQIVTRWRKGGYGGQAWLCWKPALWPLPRLSRNQWIDMPAGGGTIGHPNERLDSSIYSARTKGSRPRAVVEETQYFVLKISSPSLL